MTNPQKHTRPVSDAVFRAVYDSPTSLPGRHQWLSTDDDVRQIEELLGMPPKTIGAMGQWRSPTLSQLRSQRMPLDGTNILLFD